MSWLYEGRPFNDSMIPEGAVGFVYEMEAVINGKSVRYVGKKNFYSVTKKKFGKKAMANVTDKRTKSMRLLLNLAIKTTIVVMQFLKKLTKLV